MDDRTEPLRARWRASGTPDPNVSDTNPGQPGETQISGDATELGDLAEPNPSQQIGADDVFGEPGGVGLPVW